MKKYNIDIKVAILYSGDSEGYIDIYNNFKLSTLMNLYVSKIDMEKYSGSFNDYDMIYLDKSIVACENFRNVAKKIIKYVSGGGNMFLENSFYEHFDVEILGAKGFKKVKRFPQDIAFPDVPYNLAKISELLKDYHNLCLRFKDFDRISELDYGYALIPSTAIPIAQSGDSALYALNKFGKGYVLFTNPLLPSQSYITGMDIRQKGKDQPYFNHTAAAAGRLLQDEFVAFLAKEKHGFAFKRVFGTYGRSAMAWQNHLEALPAFKNKSMELFADMAEKSNQIPSFSLIRNPFNWFERSESIAYMLSDGDINKLSSQFGENVYCDGKHVICDNTFLTLEKTSGKVGVFEEFSSLYRTVPCVIDYNHSAAQDIICGSSDGKFYYFKGIEMNPDWKVKQGDMLKDSSGQAISVSGYSSPVLFDIDGNGKLDIISGCEDGQIYWFKNRGNFIFDAMGILLNTKDITHSVPEVCDISGNGSVDLFIGTESGNILWYKGSRADNTIKFERHLDISSLVGKNTVPRAVDLNNDGLLDLAVGTHDGYIAKLINSGGDSFEFAGYFDSEHINIKGNNYLHFGQNAAPFFADLNGNGTLDLIVGRLEYGMAIPIDSPYFPYRKELDKTLLFLQEKNIPIIPHIFAYKYKDNYCAKKELNMHKKSFKNLGLNWGNSGTNQHTWYVHTSDSRPFLEQYESGLLWNSGFQPSNSEFYPQSAAENVMPMPFFLHNEDIQTYMLIFNTATILEDSLTQLSEITGKWDIPVSVFYHCDYDVFGNPEKTQNIIDRVSEYRQNFDYNFMTEPQLAKSIASAYNVNLKISSNNKTNQAECIFSRWDLRVKSKHNKSSNRLVCEEYKKSTGVKFEIGERLLDKPVYVDANVFIKRGNDFYIGLTDTVKISGTPNLKEKISRINLPAKIKFRNGRVKVNFLDGGLLQLRIYAPSGITKFSSGWKMEKHDDNEFTFTKTGPAQTLEIKFS